MRSQKLLWMGFIYMKKQHTPHMHYEGEITLEVCSHIYWGLNELLENFPLDLSDPHPGWEACREEWLKILTKAKEKINIVRQDLISGKPMLRGYHGVIIDICLSIMNDVADAAEVGFVNPDYINPELN
jgi:hypothetical protein